MTDGNQVIDLELTSDVPAEFVRELIEIKIRTLNRIITEEINTSGKTSPEVRSLLRVRKSFQDYLAGVGTAAPAAAASATATPAGKRAVRRVVVSDESREDATGAAALQRHIRKVVVGTHGKGAAASAPAAAPPVATIETPVAEHLHHQVEVIEKQAQATGYRNAQEMLWMKRSRLKEQLDRLESTDADPRTIRVLKKELENIDFLLDGGIKKGKEQARQIKIKQAAEEKRKAEEQKRKKVAKKKVQQQKLTTELTGLLDEIK